MTPNPKDQTTPSDDGRIVEPGGTSGRLEVSLGLLEAKHRERLGPALHFYLQLLARRPFPSPWVHGGRPVSLELLAVLAGPLSAPPTVRTVGRWLRRLERYGYVRTTSVNTGTASGSGLRIRILKSKHWRAGRVKISCD